VPPSSPVEDAEIVEEVDGVLVAVPLALVVAAGVAPDFAGAVAAAGAAAAAGFAAAPVAGAGAAPADCAFAGVASDAQAAKATTRNALLRRMDDPASQSSTKGSPPSVQKRLRVHSSREGASAE
jgi:hypothetical protein